MGPRATWARDLACSLLEKPLPQRWAHTEGVAAQAQSLAPLLGEGADLVHAAAWLHDIGYNPGLAATGFHPLDGARHLRDTHHSDDLLCRLVAHHSCACIEAAERGLADVLSAEFADPPPDHLDALTYCDMTTSPDGERLTVDARLQEIGSRYADDDPVARAIRAAAPTLRAVVQRVQQRIGPVAPDS